MNYNALSSEPSPEDGLPVLYNGERLTDEEIAQINHHFTIEVYGANHGLDIERLEEHLRSPLLQATQKEYEAVGAVVHSLTRNDRLFLEAVGFTQQPAPDLYAELLRAAPENPTPLQASALEIGQTLLRQVAEYKRQAAEEVKRNYKKTTGDYAQLLAESKHIPVSYADLDATELRRLETAAGKEAVQLSLGDDDDRQKFAKLQFQRDRAAAKRVVTYALRNLPEVPEAEAEPANAQPRLVLIYGAGHLDGLQRAFDELGVEVTIHELARSTDQERLSEVMDRIMAIGADHDKNNG